MTTQYRTPVGDVPVQYALLGAIVLLAAATLAALLAGRVWLAVVTLVALSVASVVLGSILTPSDFT